ncbi:hypothetical protein ACFXHA_43390 [Nocardia sp. NPDC059240]|uniref:hypothetical protein n=1 Tax=Nocardia sp. NPDC059240 TaxID=3346786 RepID=UPI0036817E12
MGDPLTNMRHRYAPPSGWAWMFDLPQRPDGDQRHEDMSPALRWLASSPDAPAEAAEFATRYFGYDASVAATVIDLGRFTSTARVAIERALLPTEPGTFWLHTVLHGELDKRGITGEHRYYRWAADPDPASHPVIMVGDLLALHVPRVLFPLGAPSYTAVAMSGSTDDTVYVGVVVVDIDGQVAPLPLHPQDDDSVASALTAAVWAPGAELLPGGRHVIGNVPAEVRQVLKLLGTGEPLHLSWSELAAATGSGPGPHAD